jgi:hypothetical protein
VVPCAPLEDARGCGLEYAFRNIELEENGFGGVYGGKGDVGLDCGGADAPCVIIRQLK